MGATHTNVTTRRWNSGGTDKKEQVFSANVLGEKKKNAVRTVREVTVLNHPNWRIQRRSTGGSRRALLEMTAPSIGGVRQEMELCEQC